MTQAIRYGALLWGLLSLGGLAQALPLTFKDRAEFEAAVAAIPATQLTESTYENVAAGSVFPSGTTFEGIAYTYTIEDFQIGVRGNADGNTPGTSGNNNLAVTDDNGASFFQFAITDAVSFSFTVPTHAFGLYVIVGPADFDFLAEDANLSFAGITLSIADADTATAVGPNNTAALFLGIVDPMQTYTSATLGFGAAGAAVDPLFELDDLLITVPGSVPLPLPGTLVLLALGLGGLGLRRFRG